MTKADIRKNLRNLDKKEIWICIDAILDSGISMDELLDCDEPYDGYFSSHYKKLLSRGATPMKLFELNEEWYRLMTSRPRELVEVFSTYVDYGLDAEFAKDWLEANLRGEYFVTMADYFEPLGIDPKKHKTEYLERYCFGIVWEDIAFDNLPTDIITPNDAVEFYSADSILKEIAKFSGNTNESFERFVKTFNLKGGDIDLLAEKILVAYGYPEEEEKLASLATLLYYGASNIDANSIIDALTYKAYSYKDKRSIKKVNKYFYDRLQGYADEAHLKKIRGM